MPDLLETVRAEVDTRLDELRPFVSEYEQLLLSAADTSPVEIGPVEVSPAEASPSEARPPETRLPETKPFEARPPETRTTPIRLHRPRGTIRPAWPKAPRTRRPA